MDINDSFLRCDGCGIEIRWRPVLFGRFAFCCPSCLRGQTCECIDRLEIEEDRRASLSTGNPLISQGDYTP